jgi:hypothetical protein
MRLSTFSVTATAVTVILLIACQKKKTNKSLYNETQSSALGFYKGKDTLYPPAADSPHGPFKLKFNPTALSVLDASGKLPKGSEFPNGSVIVKEIHATGKPLEYAVMKKDNGSKFAEQKWVWAEYEADGKVKYDVSREGAACVSCHNVSTARDLTRSFDLH